MSLCLNKQSTCFFMLKWIFVSFHQGVDYYKAPVQGACNKDGEDCPEITPSRSGEPVRLVDRVGPDERPSEPNVPPAPPPTAGMPKRSKTGKRKPHKLQNQNSP